MFRVKGLEFRSLVFRGSGLGLKNPSKVAVLNIPEASQSRSGLRFLSTRGSTF